MFINRALTSPFERSRASAAFKRELIAWLERFGEVEKQGLVAGAEASEERRDLELRIFNNTFRVRRDLLSRQWGRQKGPHGSDMHGAMVASTAGPASVAVTAQTRPRRSVRAGRLPLAQEMAARSYS